MNLVFYLAAAVTLASTAAAITRVNPVYGLLNFVVSLLAMAVMFFTLGAAFAAALEVMVYAGAIMVLFLFVVMMLRLDAVRERRWMAGGVWVFPLLLAGLLGGELAYVLLGSTASGRSAAVSPAAVGARLFGADLVVVELASMLLLAGLIAAYHLGRPSSGAPR
jgi:NADH-quinone oxidoreductase subunit J